MRLFAAVALVLTLGACGSKGPQPAKLVDFKPSATANVVWKASVGDAGRYIFTPAISDDSVFAAGNRGDLVRLNATNGKVIWHIDTKAALSGGVGVGHNMVLVGMPRDRCSLTTSRESRFGRPRYRVKS